MPKQMSPSDRKPPLAESRLRPRRVLRSSMTSIPTPPPGSLTKIRTPTRLSNLEGGGGGGTELRPEYSSISYELQALSRMVKEEFGKNEDLSSSDNNLCISPFERGRFYDEYSARRNERLRRKRGEIVDVKKTPYNLGVKNVESGKKRGGGGGGGGDSKKLESLRKSVPANFTITRSENTRYSLRSSTKENKKPILSSSSSSSSTPAKCSTTPAAAAMVVDEERRRSITTRRVRKI